MQSDQGSDCYIRVFRAYTGSVTKYLVRVHKWSGWTNSVEYKWSPRTIYVVISGPVKT